MPLTRAHTMAGGAARVALILSMVAAVGGCSREDEAALRARLSQWFSLGETLAFNARSDCAAATFRLVDMQVKSALPVAGGIPEMLIALKRRDAVALGNPLQSPEWAMVDVVNANRSVGMSMRRAGLEARPCMGPLTESAFSYALNNPRAVLAYDTGSATLMLLDPQTSVLVVAMGAG